MVLNSAPLPIPGTADSISYDAKLNRLYFTDKEGDLEIYNTAVAPGTLPVFVQALQIPAQNAAICSQQPSANCTSLIGVTPLPDGSRVYALSMTYTTGATNTWTPTLTPVDSLSFVVQSPVNLEAAPEVIVPCGSARFRFMVGSSGGSERVYVSSCDFGGTYILKTFDNTEVQPVPSPLSSNPPSVQNPMFMITGR